MFKIKSYLYNDSDLEKFLFFKVLSLLGINFHNLYISYLGRSQDLETLPISRLSFLFIFKLGYYSYNLYLLVVGTFFAYKLLAWITKKENSDFKTFARFYLITFSRFFIYALAATIIIYSSKEIYSYFGNYNVIINKQIGMSKDNYNCFVELFHLIIPFYINYYNPSDYKKYLITA